MKRHIASLSAASVILLSAAFVHGAETTPPAAPPQAQRVPCSRPEFRQFDFWLGDWNVTTVDGKQAGTNLVTRPLGLCVLQEHWKGQGGSIGESYNTYDRESGRWHQTWVDNSGTLLTLDGGLVGSDMVLASARRMVGGKPTIDRITWSPKAANEVHQVWEQSFDDGKTWTVVFHGVYRPRA
jgi:hypothetical protein